MWTWTKRIVGAALAFLTFLGWTAAPAQAQMMGNAGTRLTVQQGVLGGTRGGFSAFGGVGLYGGGAGLYGGGAGLYGGGAGLYGGGAGLYGGGAGLYGGGVSPLYGSAYGVAGAAGVYGAMGAYGGSAYGSYSQDPYSGYLRGNAELITATGGFLKSYQDADRTREQVRQARIDTRRKVFDEYLYERTNAPTLEDERERRQALEVRRSLNQPPVTEIWSAKALNDLLRHAQQLQAGSAVRPPVPLDADLLKRVNVVAGRRAGNAGLLKNHGELAWPLALRSRKAEERRRQINTLLPKAIDQAINGKVDPQVRQELDRAVGALRALLASGAWALPPNEYLPARRFLSDLDEAVKALGQPDVGLYLTDRYAARGQNVPELIEHMTREGLEFAPALAGDEAAYVALHRALATYEHAAQGQYVSEREGRGR
jgi:hypothetical protein